MSKTIKTSVIIFIIAVSVYIFTNNVNSTGKTGCEAYLYIANNSLFECKFTVDGIDVGNLMVGKSKTYTVQLLDENKPKRLKVKVSYDDPDFIEPKSYIQLTNKIECGQTDTLYITHKK